MVPHTMFSPEGQVEDHLVLHTLSTLATDYRAAHSCPALPEASKTGTQRSSRPRETRDGIFH